MSAPAQQSTTGANATSSTASATAPAPTSTTSTPSNTFSRYRNGNRNRENNQRSTPRLFPKIPEIETLATSSEHKGQDFAKFQKSLYHHVLTTFRNSKDMSQAILEFTDPLNALKKARPSLSDIRNENNLNLIPPSEKESEATKFTREADNNDRKEMAKIFFNNEVKAHTERIRDLTQNLTILWATILGQCTPALQEEINGEPDYLVKAAEFDSIWLLQTLQKITAGVNKTTNKYYSVFKAVKSFYATQQAQGEGIDEFFHKFDTAKDLVQLFGADIVNVSE